METMVASVTVRLAVADRLLMAAVIVTAVLDANTPVATPFVPEAFEMDATEVLLDVQVTSLVMSEVVPLLKVPAAVNG
jgi:hypothetical protein